MTPEERAELRRFLTAPVGTTVVVPTDRIVSLLDALDAAEKRAEEQAKLIESMAKEKLAMSIEVNQFEILYERRAKELNEAYDERDRLRKAGEERKGDGE